MEAADLKKNCRTCGQNIVGHMVSVKGFSRVTNYHPGCLNCTECKANIGVGTKFTQEKDGPKCGDCFQKWAAIHIKKPGGGTSSHVPKTKMTEERGHVWQQVQLIEANKPPPQTEGPKLDKESTARQGNLGTCARCSKPIFGTLVQIEGRRAGQELWLDLHQDCHQCTRCEAVFEDGQSFVRDTAGHTVCESCYARDLQKAASAPKTMHSEVQEAEQTSMGKCLKCGKDVYLKATLVKGKTFHPECHACKKCHKVLSATDAFFPEPNNEALCENCG